MGLFGSAPVDLDPRVAGVLTAPDPARDKAGYKAAAKAVSNESGAILANTSSAGDAPLAIAYDSFNNEVLVVTDRRSFTIKRGKIKKELAHSEVAETKLGSLPNGKILVIIESHESRLDFSPNDPMRFSKIIQVQVSTPRIGNVICAHIDQRLNG